MLYLLGYVYVIEREKPTQTASHKRSFCVGKVLLQFTHPLLLESHLTKAGKTHQLLRHLHTPISDIRVLPLVWALTAVCQNIICLCDLLIEATKQQCWLPKSDWLFSFAFGNSREGSYRSGKVSSMTVAGVTWVEMVEMQADPVSPNPTRVQITNSSCPGIQYHVANGERSF